MEAEAEVENCHKCGGIPVTHNFLISGESRYRLQCPTCQSMSLHFPSSALALIDWNATQQQMKGRRTS